jgi:hypothetical protein
VKGKLTQRFVANTKSDYATHEDLCKLFANNVKTFYLLPFLSTTNWARSSTRRLRSAFASTAQS